MFDSSKFAYNVKQNRQRLGLTQKELSEMMYVSPQNVSKWEKGLCAPDIENLCSLAEIFGISLDKLVGADFAKANEKTYLAIDGGGTKTEFLLFTEKGEVLHRRRLGAGNPNTVGVEGTCRVLCEGIDEMLAVSGNIAGVCAGIAGCGNSEHRKNVLKHLRKTYPSLRCEISSDIVNVIGSCTECRDNCLAVICGTGSVVYAKKGNDLFQVGGWGYLLDGAGSGYDIGREAIRTALAERDGFGAHSLITNEVEEKLGAPVKSNVNLLYTRGKDYIASFASIVFDCARNGDAAALEIIDDNTDRLAHLVNFAAVEYGCREGIIFSGGLTAERELFGDSLASKISKDLRLIYCEVPQIIGSAATCLERYGARCENGDFVGILAESYRKYLISEENQNA